MKKWAEPKKSIDSRVKLSESGFEQFANPENLLCVWLDSFSGAVTLVSDGQVYFSRRLEKNENEWDIRVLQQEIERSIDYAVNQLGRPKIDRIELIIPSNDEGRLLGALEDQLEVPMELFTLDQGYGFSDESVQKKLGSAHLAAVGAAVYPVH